MSTLSDHDDARGAILDAAVLDNAVKLEARLRTMEAQDKAERERFPAAPEPEPEPKAKAASKK